MSIIEKAIAKLNTTKQTTESKSNNEVSLNEPAFEHTPEHDFKVHFKTETLSAAGIVAPGDETPYLADEFRRIKRPLINNAFGSSSELVENGNVIMVTSSLPGEGKSFTAVNLAISIALEKDFTVLLIDADMAVTKITRMFRLENYPGLTDKLENNQIDLADLLVKTDFPGLSIMPSGKQTTHATELISSKVAVELINEISNRYSNRIVIFDSPPLLATPEAAVLAEHVGQIVMVVEANKTAQSAVLEAIGMLNHDKAIGLVLNKTSKGFGYAQYGNYYAYGHNS